MNQYLGMGVLFGLMRFPKTEFYWKNSPHLLGGIEICMQEGRYNFIEKHMFKFQSENDSQRFMGLLREVRKSWRKLYGSDQELVLMGVRRRNHVGYYLLDAETLFIQEMTIAQNDCKNLFEMIATFAKQNHILYFQRDTLDLKLVNSLAENQIFCVGEISEEQLLKDEDSRSFYRQMFFTGRVYSNGRLCFSRNEDRIFVFPTKSLRRDAPQNNQYYMEQYLTHM
jgi:hypothetical protein